MKTTKRQQSTSLLQINGRDEREPPEIVDTILAQSKFMHLQITKSQRTYFIWRLQELH